MAPIRIPIESRRAFGSLQVFARVPPGPIDRLRSNGSEIDSRISDSQYRIYDDIVQENFLVKVPVDAWNRLTGYTYGSNRDHWGLVEGGATDEATRDQEAAGIRSRSGRIGCAASQPARTRGLGGVWVRTPLEKLRDILATLDQSRGPEGMNLPGFRLHELKGSLKGQWAVSVSGNWRVTFRFEDGAAVDVDYMDDH